MIVRLFQSIYNNTVFSIARLRVLFWGLFLKKIGTGCQFMAGVKIASPFNVEIGNNTLLNHHVELGGHMELKIGNNVMIGPYSQIITANHSYRDFKLPMKNQEIECSQITIGDDVWIGVFAVILPGVKIGRGAVIGAHSVVTHDVDPFSIVGGVPAKFIRYRFSKEKIKKAIRA